MRNRRSVLEASGRTATQLPLLSSRRSSEGCASTACVQAGGVCVRVCARALRPSRAARPPALPPPPHPPPPQAPPAASTEHGKGSTASVARGPGGTVPPRRRLSAWYMQHYTTGTWYLFSAGEKGRTGPFALKSSEAGRALCGPSALKRYNCRSTSTYNCTWYYGKYVCMYDVCIQSAP